MGDFRSEIFSWLAAGARHYPKVRRKPQGPLPVGMKDSDLKLTDAFKDELFRLVVLRAHAFMQATGQDAVSDPTKRFATISLQIHIDAGSIATHGETYTGKEPWGYGRLRRVAGFGASSRSQKAIPGVRIMPEWYDNSDVKQQLGLLQVSPLSCKPNTPTSKAVPKGRSSAKKSLSVKSRAPARSARNRSRSA